MGEKERRKEMTALAIFGAKSIALGVYRAIHTLYEDMYLRKESALMRQYYQKTA